ncbi:MAG: tail fiber domain-containing protein, partial [Acidobacteriota bacterium]
TTPFRIDGSAPAAAVHVGSSGSVGLGTTTPQTKLHLVTGNTPTLRLEQDGSGSFLPAVWDLAANEGGMFIREQDGSAFGVLPFRIRNGAPASSLYVAGSGSVGVGTAAPAGPLHVFRNAGTDPLEMLILENNGKPRLVLDNSTDAGGRWFFGLNNSSEFVISLQGSPANELRLDQAGNGTFRGALNATAFNPVSDVHAKHRIEAVEPDKVLEALANLPIATWAFRGEAVRHIGPMAQDFHAAFGFGDDPRRISTHDTDGVALAAIQGLHSIVKTKDAEIQALEARLAALEALVTALSEGG